MKYLFPALISGLVSLSVSAAGTVEQRLEKVERQMSRLTVLMMEMQDLRTDLQQNYGAVEEMVHKLDQLKREQSSSYLDLQQRIKRLESGSSRPKKPQPSITERSDNQEVESYNSAFAMVRENRTKEALDAFNSLVKMFPKGNYSGDAWYWIGRLHTVNGDKSKAIKAYAQARSILKGIVKEMPGTPQAERAALKLKKITK